MSVISSSLCRPSSVIRPTPSYRRTVHYGDSVFYPPAGVPFKAHRSLRYARLPPFTRPKSRPQEWRCSSSSSQNQQSTEEFERLFSNLNQATLKREPGSVVSGIFLVAGTTVGAGILAIPAVTQESGFLASSVVCILSWIYMVVTGLLIAEVNVNTMCELGSGGVSLVSMAMRTLGKAGVQVACCSYIFIHYALLVAYIARSSNILTDFLNIPVWESASLFSLVFGGICYFGSQRLIGLISGILVFGIIGSFVALVGFAGGNLHWENLLKANFEAAPPSIPIITLSFVYQNVVPVLCTNLEGNLLKVRTAIVYGTTIPLVLFLVWDAVILGTIPDLNFNGRAVVDPLEHLISSNGTIGPVVQVFSLLAIASSFIGFVLGLSDFLSDRKSCILDSYSDDDLVTSIMMSILLDVMTLNFLLHGISVLKLPSGQSKPLPYLLTLFPPLLLSLLDPEIFFKALDFAGTYGVLVLFGIIPAAMSWSERYSDSSYRPNLPELIPGGRPTLLLVIGGASLVILTEILDNFQHS